MDGRELVTVITDGDKAMRATVRDVFLRAYHQLCAWHLARNTQTYVHNRDFATTFMMLMFAGMTVSEFEGRWRRMVEGLGLERNR